MHWLKRLLGIKPMWACEYVCTGCREQYCGDCGRGVADCDYFYTKEEALFAAEDWVCQQEGDPGYKCHVKEENGEVFVSLKPDGESGNLYGHVYKRRY